MLNISFTRDSAPISDADLLAVIDGVRAHLQSPDDVLRDQALLLSKMALRIDQLRVEHCEKQATADTCELRRLARYATPGQWRAEDPTQELHAIRTGSGKLVCDVGYSGSFYEDICNAEFIAAASPTVIIGICDELEAARAEVARQARVIVNFSRQADDDLAKIANLGIECDTLRHGLRLADNRTANFGEDAARYQWLRSFWINDTDSTTCHALGNAETPSKIDEIVDAAIKSNSCTSCSSSAVAADDAMERKA
ncbi:MAG: hypothetical protein JWR22_1292 [Herminiimonas sp.]|nr:hypothetical protein [Herminiimonas sp.]